MTDEKTSPNLGVVSNEGGDPASGNWTERRRVPRLNLATEQFRLTANGKIFPVVDLSNTGMALRVMDREDLLLFPVGAPLHGILNFNRLKHEIRGRVRRLGRDVVGCEFEDLPLLTAEALADFLAPEVLGRDLRPIPSSEPGMLWYHGSSGTHLLLWRSMDGQYHRLELSALGHYVQWDSELGLSTGRVDSSLEAAEVRGAIRFEIHLLERDSSPDPGKLSIAKRVVLSSNLPQDLKGWCVRRLNPESTN